MMSKLTDMLGMRTDEEAQTFREQFAASVQESLQEEWQALQSTPSYVETLAARFLADADLGYFCGSCGGFVAIDAPCSHLM
jgi:hypothetical protein